MMKYQEITIIPSSEIPNYVVFEKLFNDLHIGLVDIRHKANIDSIGISFPEYGLRNLGNKLRLIAPDEQTLALLGIEQRLQKLRDYIHIRSVADVPEKVRSVRVKRYRFRPIEQQAKRHADRHHLSFEAALEHCLTYRRKEIFPPFIQLKSHTNGKPFPLVILQEEVDHIKYGKYTTYGLSQDDSTVPHW